MMRSSSELLMEILHDAVSVSRMAHCSIMQANASHGSSRACSIITSFTAFSGAHPAHHHLDHPLVFFASNDAKHTLVQERWKSSMSKPRSDRSLHVPIHFELDAN